MCFIQSFRKPTLKVPPCLIFIFYFGGGATQFKMTTTPAIAITEMSSWLYKDRAEVMGEEGLSLKKLTLDVVTMAFKTVAMFWT